MTKRMKQKKHIRRESFDSEGHTDLGFFLSICCMNNEGLLCMFCGALCNFLPPMGSVLGLQHLW